MPFLLPRRRLPRRPLALLLALCLLPLPAAADEETAAMLLTFDTPAALGRVMAEPAEPADPEQDRFDRWILENLYDEDAVARRLGLALDPLISAEDRASFRTFAERGGREFTAALKAAPGSSLRDRAAELPRRTRQAFEAYDATGAAERLFAAIESPTVTAAFMGYFSELYCRAAREEAPELWGDRADDSCAAAEMFSGRQSAPGPELAAGASPEAVAVLRLFNAPWLMRASFELEIRNAANPAEAALFRAILDDHLDEDELLSVIGAELDRRVSGADLARAAAFIATDPGRQLAAAMRDKMPEEMTGAAAALPAATQREIASYFADGSLQRIAVAMNDPGFKQIGIRYGQLLFCRAAPEHMPEVVPALIAGGICRADTMGAPAAGGTRKGDDNQAPRK